jgi:hypothetical protein
MKSVTSALIFFLILFNVCAGQSNCDDTAKYSLGKMNLNWSYTNPQLKITYQFQKGWYFISSLDSDPEFIPVGSDINKIPSYCFLESKRTIRIFKKSRIGQAETIFATSQRKNFKIGDRMQPIPEQESAVFFGLAYAAVKPENEYLLTVYKTLTGSDLEENEIKDCKIGNTTFKAYTLTRKLPDGSMLHRLAGVKNMGCVNLVFSIIYITDEELAGIKKGLDSFKVQ